MESSGFTEMVMKMKPSRFEDIIAAGALYRPGPLDQKLEDGRTMVDVYIDRKHGREKVQYPHPLLEPILEPTYGVIVYQEQVMQIAQVLGGYSLGGADLLRRAMGKKKAEEMAKQRVIFERGAAAQGVDEKVATYVFDLMEKFAAYGFNKSHSAAYGLLTVQTAWLKAHYPVEFMAALISSEASNTDKVVLHISEARASGIEVLPPDVNESGKDFGTFPGLSCRGGRRWPPRSLIRLPLRSLTGLPGQGTHPLRAGRGPRAWARRRWRPSSRRASEGGPFKHLFDLASRVDARRINKKVIEALVKGGAFDFEGVPRWQLFFGIDAAFAAGASAQADRASGQASLFGGPAAAAVEARPRYPRAG